MWLRNVCSTRVTATWSSMAIVTLWFSIANGGNVLSSGISMPRAQTGPVLASTTASAIVSGRSGISIDPVGLVLVFVPVRLVGEYWPLVRP